MPPYATKTKFLVWSLKTQVGPKHWFCFKRPRCNSWSSKWYPGYRFQNFNQKLKAKRFLIW